MLQDAPFSPMFLIRLNCLRDQVGIVANNAHETSNNYVLDCRLRDINLHHHFMQAVSLGGQINPL